MTRREFSQALTMAKSSQDLSVVDDSVLYGCGLPDFQPVVCTLEMVAKLLRWQCIMFNGEVDSQELENCSKICARKVFLV